MEKGLVPTYQSDDYKRHSNRIWKHPDISLSTHDNPWHMINSSQSEALSIPFLTA